MSSKSILVRNIVPGWAKEFVVGTGVVQFKKRDFEYSILKPEMAPQLPGFMGYTADSFLFISEEVPEAYRPFCLSHELYERLVRDGEPQRCRDALSWELDKVPREMYLQYWNWRKKFFQRLVWYYNEGPGANAEMEEDFREEIQASLEFLET